MVGYIPCILFKFYLKDRCCLVMADSFWILLSCIVFEQGIDRRVEMEFHLSCLYSSLRVCLYVEKETGALAILFGHKPSYAILEYLSRVGTFPKVRFDGSGGPCLQAINICWFLYIRMGSRVGWLFSSVLVTIINEPSELMGCFDMLLGFSPANTIQPRVFQDTGLWEHRHFQIVIMVKYT